eukprot:403396-Prymnesium_polylepis.2
MGMRSTRPSPPGCASSGRGSSEVEVEGNADSMRTMLLRASLLSSDGAMSCAASSSAIKRAREG